MSSVHRIVWAAAMAVVSQGLVAGCAASDSESDSDSHKAEKESGEERGEQRAEVSDRVTLSPEALESMHLTYARAEERELVPALEVPAELVPVPDKRATIGPRVAGRVVEVSVNVGDRVESGAVLAVLESEAVGRAWADYITARARESVARRALKRQRELIQGRITPRRALEEAEGALQVAKADLQAARTRLATFGILASGRAPRNPARVTLTSPIAGTVVARSVHVGQWVEPSETAIEVIDLDQLWVQASVYEREMRLVSVGQSAQIEVRALPGEVFTGTVAQVAGTLDERTRTVAVRVVLPNPKHRLRPGMFATARIQGTHAHEPKRLLAIPWEAVEQVDSHPAVFVKVGEGTFELRRVHTGERAGELVEVLNGLAVGDEVVAEGSFLLKGQLLRSSLGEDE